MNLKQKSIIISFSTTLLLILTIVVVIVGVTMIKFQEIENQRVERNIRRVSAIIEDRFTQINTKLADWTIWDDTYRFLQDKNKAYINSNLTQESFATLGIDEALFINNKGGFVAEVQIENDQDNAANPPQDFYQYFSTGSALVKTNPETGNNHGLIKTDNGLAIFVARDVFQSDNTGNSAGTVVFARYFDEEVLDSMRDLTQFEASMYLWDDSQMPNDFSVAKNGYIDEGKEELIRVLDTQTISGYLVVKDIFGDPQLIVRSDIGRDITTQGRSSMSMLMWILVVTGIITAGINYWLITGGVLRKVALMSSDVENLGKSRKLDERLLLGKSNDEVDKLRKQINTMLGSLYESKSELSAEKQKGESLIDLVNAIVVLLDNDGKVKMINKYGLELLGYQEAEILGQDWLNTIVSPKSRAKIIKTFKNLTSDNIDGAEHADNEVITKNGKILVISWHNTLIKDANNKVISTLSLGEDITKDKKEEIEKEAYSKELEKLNELMVNRELMMIHLKKEINLLKSKK